MNEPSVISYSPVQKAWHIEPLSEHFRTNLKALAGGVLDVTAYCGVALCDSHEKAHEEAGRLQRKLEEVEGARPC